MKLKYGITVILAGVLSGVVWADQPTASAGEFYVNPGIAATGAGASGYNNSFSLDAGYLKTVHQIALVGWEAGYLFGSKFEGDPGEPSAKILHVSPEIKVGPTFSVSGYNVRAFVIGGGGFYWTHQNSGTASPSFDNYNGGWNIGPGVSVSLPGNWSVGMDIRRHEIVNKHATDFTWITPALNFSLLFS